MAKERLQYHERARVIFNSKVHANGKLILLALSDRMWKRDEAFPSYETLASDTSLCRRSVINHVQRLIDEEVLINKRESSSRRSNTYEIEWEKLALVQTVHHRDSERRALTPNESSERGAPSIVNDVHPIVQIVHPKGKKKRKS